VLPQLLLRLIRRRHHRVGAEQGDEVDAILGLNLPGTPEVVGVAVQQFRVGGQRLEGGLCDLRPGGLGEGDEVPADQPAISGRVDRARKHLQDYVEFGAVQALKRLGDSLDD
jgi:hypothetical protein